MKLVRLRMRDLTPTYDVVAAFVLSPSQSRFSRYKTIKLVCLHAMTTNNLSVLAHDWLMHLRMMSTMSAIDKWFASTRLAESITSRPPMGLKSTFRYKLDVAFTSLSRTRYALAVLFKSALCIRWLAAAIVPELLGTSFATVYFLKLLGPWSTTIASFPPRYYFVLWMMKNLYLKSFTGLYAGLTNHWWFA